jgi:transketolase
VTAAYRVIASGSEVSLAIEAHEKLVAEGIRSRVVSMPSWDIFEHQPREYRDSVLPPAVKARVAIEQASTFGWERYVGDAGRVIGMKTFGASAPLKELQKRSRVRAEKNGRTKSFKLTQEFERYFGEEKERIKERLEASQKKTPVEEPVKPEKAEKKK